MYDYRTRTIDGIEYRLVPDGSSATYTTYQVYADGEQQPLTVVERHGANHWVLFYKQHMSHRVSPRKNELVETQRRAQFTNQCDMFAKVAEVSHG